MWGASCVVKSRWPLMTIIHQVPQAFNHKFKRKWKTMKTLRAIHYCSVISKVLRYQSLLSILEWAANRPYINFFWENLPWQITYSQQFGRKCQNIDQDILCRNPLIFHYKPNTKFDRLSLYFSHCNFVQCRYIFSLHDDSCSWYTRVGFLKSYIKRNLQTSRTESKTSSNLYDFCGHNII